MVNIPHWPQIPIWKIPQKIDLKLSFKLLNAIGNPHQKLPLTIHIAGTNGKGSTVAILKAILMKAGLKVHSYTSPHLLEFNERIMLDNVAITDSHLHSVLERVKHAAELESLTPSFFEGTTAAAFLAFSETNADVLLLETGLGGRLDCTNVIASPIATIITSISYDHMEYLGHDLLQIATEKSGIIKHRTPCIIGPQSPEVYKLLLDICNEGEAPAFCYEYDYHIEKTEQGFKYISQKFNLDMPLPNLVGEHQIFNASSVIAAIMLLNEQLQITTQQIKQGLTQAVWPGRLELIPHEISNVIAGKNVQIYLDGAHNEAGAQVLSHWARCNLQGPVYLILGMTRNRNATIFCKYFKDFATKGIAVPVLSEPSGHNAHGLALMAGESGIEFSANDSLMDAIREICFFDKKEPSTIIVTGSLFLISDFKKIILEHVAIQSL